MLCNYHVIVCDGILCSCMWCTRAIFDTFYQIKIDLKKKYIQTTNITILTIFVKQKHIVYLTKHLNINCYALTRTDMLDIHYVGICYFVILFSSQDCHCAEKLYLTILFNISFVSLKIIHRCTGFLMMQDAVGAEKIVYNPYSLQYLLNSQAETSSKYWQQYLECIQFKESKRDFFESCNLYKPHFAIFEQQNVDVLQVISRCRENYNHKRWDEASILFALFSADEWLQNNLQASVSSTRDDKFVRIRLKIIDLISLVPRSHLNHLIPQERASWYTIHDCLQNALHSGQMTNRCHLVGKSIEFQEKQFDYVIVQTQYAKLFRYIDSCRVLSKEDALSDGLLNATMPRYLWSGNSQNSVPLAILHNENHRTKEQIVAKARLDLQYLLQEKIVPEFARLENNKLLESLQDELTVASFSVEGDEITQLLDCVVMGPYAAANLGFTLHTPDQTIPTPMYHRGDRSSRSFTSWGPVSGTNARQLFHSEIMAQIAEQGVNQIATEAYNHFLYIRKLFLEPAADDELNRENGLAPSLMCACHHTITVQENVVSPSLDCCYLNVQYGTWTRRTDIQFSNMQYDVNRPIANIGSQVLDSVFNILVSQPENGLQWVQLLEKPTYGRGRPIHDAESTLLQTLEAKLTLTAQEVAAFGIDDLQADDYFYLQTEENISLQTKYYMPKVAVTEQWQLVPAGTTPQGVTRSILFSGTGN